MKKYLALLAAMVLMLGLCACGGNAPQTSAPATEATTLPATEPTTVPTTAPQEQTTVVGGVDLSALTEQEAAAALTEAAAAYQLSLTVNGTNLTVPAEKIGLKLDEAALKQYLQALNSGAELPAALFTYDREALKGLLSAGLNTAPVNATAAYNSSKKQFEAVAGKNGTTVDADAAADAAAAALGMLITDAAAEVKTTEVAPEITASGEKMTAALKKANGYLSVSLTYTYSPEGGKSSK